MGWLLLELITFGVIFFGLTTLLAVIVRSFDHHLFETAIDINENSNPFTLLLDTGFLFVFIVSLVTAILVYHVIFRHPLNQLGLRFTGSLKLFGKGWLVSSILILIGFLIITAFGQFQFFTSYWNAKYFFGFLVFFIVQSTAEEIITRAYLIPTIENWLGTIPALIVSASLFAIMHLGNENFTWMGFFNILLGGLILAALFVKYRNLWLCAGFHSGWNFMQGTFLDFNVSGVDVYSWMQFKPIGYSRITGGDFGFEGSLVSVLALIVLIGILHKKMPLTYNKFPIDRLVKKDNAILNPLTDPPTTREEGIN